MSYQVLYRRFRPQNFSEIVGQDHITAILKNQIINGNVAHAYLFSGPRGTGKTSAAKVFARAVNCSSPVNGEACGKCPSCMAAENDRLSDVIEIDAASNRGIDEIRDLIDKINYLPANGRYRVYIIDEVHMLTAESFNALLKTIEEPPEHVIFIFATTDVSKVLPTILSRCQRFDFVRIADEVIKQQLRKVLENIGYSFEEEALDVIVAAADGAMRDALSVTDKILGAAQNNTVTLANAEEALGLKGDDDIIKTARCVVMQDAAGALAALDEMIASGRDIEDVLRALSEYFRNLMVYSACGDGRLVLKGEKYSASLNELSQGLAADTAINYVSVLAKVKSDSRFLTGMRPLLEAALVKLCYTDSFNDTASLMLRVEKLERRLENLRKTGREALPARESEVFAAAGSDKTERNSEITSPAADDAKAALSAESGVKDDAAVDPTGKAALKEIKNALIFAGNYVNNSSRDLTLKGFFDDMSPAYYDGKTLKMYPTGGSVHMMELFEKKKGLEILTGILEKKLGKRLNIIITESPDMSAEGLINSAMEILGGLEEIKE